MDSQAHALDGCFKMSIMKEVKLRPSHFKLNLMGKIGERNFGEFMVIRQIRQRFPPPTFPPAKVSLHTVDDNHVTHSMC